MGAYANIFAEGLIRRALQECRERASRAAILASACAASVSQGLLVPSLLVPVPASLDIGCSARRPDKASSADSFAANSNSSCCPLARPWR